MANQIAQLRWSGPCATTGYTLDELEEELEGIARPLWAKRAALAIFRSYASSWPMEGHVGTWPAGQRRRPALPVLRALVVAAMAFHDGHFVLPDDVMEANAYRREGAPQYLPEPAWVEQFAVFVCLEYNIGGLCDVRYIANVTNGRFLNVPDPR